MRPFQRVCKLRCTRPPCQASPSSSGVTATGLKAVEGLPCSRPRRISTSPAIKARRLTSLASRIRRTASSPCSGVAAMGTSPVMTASSASKSMSMASSGTTMSSQGPNMASLPPWYISGSV